MAMNTNYVDTKTFIKRGLFVVPAKVITFPSGTGERYADLRIFNRTGKVVVFRVTSNNAARYQVFPRYGFILNNSSTSLRAMTFGLTEELPGRSGGIFLLQVTIGPRVDRNSRLPDNFDPESFWKELFGEHISDNEAFLVYEREIYVNFARPKSSRLLHWIGRDSKKEAAKQRGNLNKNVKIEKNVEQNYKFLQEIDPNETTALIRQKKRHRCVLL